MALDSEAKQRIQVALALALLIAGGRTAYVLYERHLDATLPAKKEERPLDPDSYVTPKKLYPYDLKSAKQLTQQSVWIQQGYFFPYFTYSPATHRVDFLHPDGKLLPLQKLEIKDIVVDRDPDSPNPQIMAVYDQDGHPYAFEIGTVQGSEYKFRADDMLFYEDPQQLYKHWPPDVWDAISKHQAKPGMNVLQVQFAIGFGLLTPGTSGSSELDRTLHYSNGGNPLTVTYVNGRVTTITPGA
jgi:hypothetical protein